MYRTNINMNSILQKNSRKALTISRVKINIEKNQDSRQLQGL